MKSTVLVLLTICHIYSVLSQNGGPKVKINSGEIRGLYLNSREGRQFSAFLGIPYSKPAVRFELAEPPEKWQGTRNATAFGDICLQQKMFSTELGGSDDCLFLNVYSRKLTGDLPVMVFIHGGAFQGGSSDIYNGNYFMDEDIVLVTINYRLGPLGFLNTGDGEMEGNLGLKDQVLALKWVQQNIRKFGGNPKKVTIFGESAGSACVHYHVLSPLSKGLFSQAIMQSGSAINGWALNKNPGKDAFAIGNSLGCNTQNSSELISCLKGKDFSDIYNATNQLADWNGDPISAVPSIEKPGKNTKLIFLPDSPINILKSGNYNKVTAIFTICEDEGMILKALPVVRSPQSLKELNEDPGILPIALYYHRDGYTSTQQNDISTKIKNFYFGNKTIGEETLQDLSNMYSDRGFITQIEDAIALHSKNHKVYSGLFSYKGLFSFASLFGYTKPVVTHADDVQYFFPSREIFPKFPPGSKEENASKYFVSLWANFAKTGNPGAKWTRLEWESVDDAATEKSGLTYWNLDFPPQKLENPFKDRMQFWKDTLK